MKKVGILGGGSWGTALAQVLGQKGHEVMLWGRDPELIASIQKHRRNPRYLCEFELSRQIQATASLQEAITEKDLLLIVVPSHGIRKLLGDLRIQLETQYTANPPLLVTASKGIENDSLMTMHELLVDILPERFHEGLAVISGPSFAREVMQQMPTAVTVASVNDKTANAVQEFFQADYFRTFTSDDVMGVELAGALKNVIAIAVGISDGLGYGMNSRAALIARGLSEIAQLGHQMGAKTITFLGLAGMGDLILTCTGDLSRNRQVGLALAQGKKIKDILKEMTMVAEGIKTARSAYELAIKHKLEMIICEKVYEVIYQNADPKKILKELMTRSSRPEFPWLNEKV